MPLRGLPAVDAPVRAALVARHRHALASDRRRNEQAAERSGAVLRLRDAVAHRLVLLRRQQPRVHVVDRERLPDERRRLRRERLRRRRVLAGHVGLRHRTLFNRPERLAGHAIEDVEEAGLARVSDRVDVAAVLTHRDELRRRHVVEIPQVVMDRLEVPESLARPRVERDDAVGEEIRAVSIGAVEVVGRRTGHEVDDAARARRPTSRPSCSRRRCTCSPPSDSSRSRTRRAPAPCGTARPSVR